MIRGAFKDR